MNSSCVVRPLLAGDDMRSQRVFPGFDSPADVYAEQPTRDTEHDSGDGQGTGRMASGSDFEETYLDWPPRRRKSAANEAEPQPGALRRLRRALR